MSTAAELVPADNMTALEQLDPQAREIAVTHMLSEARGWLAHAMESTEPRSIANFKAQMAAVEEMTKQLNLSKAIQLDATEMVRRAERGVGVAIRRGQEEGAVRTRKDAWVNGNDSTTGGRDETSGKSSPADFASKNELSGGSAPGLGIYGMTDGVSDEQFEQAIEEAKDEGNLSRANVARKAKGEAPQRSERPELLRKRRRIDPVRIISSTVEALEGTRVSLSLLEEGHFGELDPEDAAAWSSSLTESIRSLNHLNRQLKELNQA